MKTLKVCLLVMLLILTAANSFSQGAYGEIRGRLTDSLTKQPVMFASVAAFINDKLIATATSNENGYYSLKPLTAGDYTVKTSLMGYHPYTTTAVQVNSSSMTSLNMMLASKDVELAGPIINEYKVPLISPTGTTNVITEEEIEAMPYTSAIDIAATGAGIVQSDTGEGLNVRGSREDGTQYIIDGVKVIGGFNIPKGAIKEIKVLTGGIPAMFGDATGGVVVITTKGFTNW